MEKLMLSVVLSILKFLINRFTQTRLNISCSLARRKRANLAHVVFIGITGSAGKTLAKELTANILASFGACRKTHDSYNRIWAVASVIRHTGKSYRYCVAEIGASGPGTVRRSAELFQPDVAVLTVIGREHYSAFKSIERIAAEKEELIAALPPDGTAILNIDDLNVRAIGERCSRRVIWIGKGEGATLRLLEARSLWPEPLKIDFDYQGNIYSVQTQLHGTYQALSVLASLGVALTLDLPLDRAIAAIGRMRPVRGRMEPVIDKQGVMFIRDDVKAPQWSLHAPMEFLKGIKADRKIAILGTISDSTGDSTKRYKKIGREFRQAFDKVIFVGPHAHRGQRARKDENDMSIQGFYNIRAAADYLQTFLQKGDMVLLKGSNGANHLVRLFLDRNRSVACWKEDCREEISCEECREVHHQSPFVSLIAPVTRHMIKLDVDA
jgi:UDP-N-acetylmuramoyl-tripeptide--D-alanyl-D-alanine ligase